MRLTSFAAVVLLSLTVLAADPPAGPPTTQPDAVTVQALLEELPDEVLPEVGARHWATDPTGAGKLLRARIKAGGFVVEIVDTPALIRPPKKMKVGDKDLEIGSMLAGMYPVTVRGRVIDVKWQAKFDQETAQAFAAMKDQPRRLRITGTPNQMGSIYHRDHEHPRLGVMLENCSFTDEPAEPAPTSAPSADMTPTPAASSAR